MLTGAMSLLIRSNISSSEHFVVLFSDFFILGDIKRITTAVTKLYSVNEATMSYKLSPNGFQKSFQFNNHLRLPSRHQNNHQYSDDDECSFTTDNPDSFDPKKISPLEEEIKNAIISEGFRTAISVLYAFTVFLMASFVLAVVHDRLPDANSYPPLPDVFLENIPVIPGSFAICEICASVMMFFWILILIFHKHRLVVLRRSCAISGTIFLLRCFTMYVTSLSVPAKHSECFPTVSYF